MGETENAFTVVKGKPLTDVGTVELAKSTLSSFVHGDVLGYSSFFCDGCKLLNSIRALCNVKRGGSSLFYVLMK
jgi:ABC-type uncharacterized transport system YnjBCD ATPase subunit